jgi:hypothetical protein
MEGLLAPLVFASIGGFFALVSLALNNRLLNAMLILSPALITTLYGPMTGQSAFALASGGSVSDRIKYIILFLGPFAVGLVGALNQRRLEGEDLDSRNSLSGRVCIATIFFTAGLKLVSIFLLSPENGKGQSVYVPAVATAITLASILVLCSTLIRIEDARRALEIFMFTLYTFLILNSFWHLVTWPVQPEVFRFRQTDELRFSPFAEVLQAPGRLAYFDTDPQSFAVYSCMAFSILVFSRITLFRYLGSIFVFIVGSTTQSRLFYLAIISIIVLVLLRTLAPGFSKILIRGNLILIFSLYIYFLVLQPLGNNQTVVNSFSGRTEVWRMVLIHWNDRGILLGNQGTYSVSELSAENAGRLIFFHSHNLILQYLWDWGLFGLSLGLVFCASLFFATRMMDFQGLLLVTAITFTGLIEVTLPNTLLSSKFIFSLLLVKYLSTPKPVHLNPMRRV